MACGRKLARRNSSASPRPRNTLAAFGVICMPAPTSPNAVRPLEYLDLDAALGQRPGQRDAAYAAADDADP